MVWIVFDVIRVHITLMFYIFVKIMQIIFSVLTSSWTILYLGIIALGALFLVSMVIILFYALNRLSPIFSSIFKDSPDFHRLSLNSIYYFDESREALVDRRRSVAERELEEKVFAVKKVTVDLSEEAISG